MAMVKSKLVAAGILVECKSGYVTPHTQQSLLLLQIEHDKWGVCSPSCCPVMFVNRRFALQPGCTWLF